MRFLLEYTLNCFGTHLISIMRSLARNSESLVKTSGFVNGLVDFSDGKQSCPQFSHLTIEIVFILSKTAGSLAISPTSTLLNPLPTTPSFQLILAPAASPASGETWNDAPSQSSEPIMSELCSDRIRVETP